ncbi:putative disease resistance protein RGA3 [Cajanus cajan]|uniref:putative disease resistance protein RGA3 n=1 Tax=Cajanus cajan TaxID=3821 RepID=UPI0010FB9702|nr:putative disease resistance protein RGA3 [Cajanus cajan]
METVIFEDACADFASMVDDEVGSFSVSRMRVGGEKLVRAVDKIVENARKDMKEVEPQFLEFQHSLKRLVEDLTLLLGPLSSSTPFEINLRRMLRQTLNRIRNHLICHVARIRSTVSHLICQASPVDGVQAQAHIYGRNHDYGKIVEFLCSQAQTHASHILSIYPIVGMSGIGKTTLAQLVYNHQRVSTHFDVRIWISFSANFSVKKILCSIIDSVAQEKYDHYDLDVVERKVRDLLQWKRYLLVLDDLHLVYGELNELKSMLTRGSKGSCILVTTLFKEVAQVMGTFGPHHLTPLSEDHCWSVFKQYAFRPGEQEPEVLKRIGKEIVKKCEGLPLAAQALGVLMRSMNKEHEWLRVVHNWSWHSEPELEIMKDDLIHLWMANGFISSDGNLEVEQVGDIIWNELYHKLFFTDVKTDDYSGDISFKMLGPVQEFVESTKSGDCVILDNYNKTSFSKKGHKLEELRGLNLGGKLCIEGLKYVGSLYEAEGANLMGKTKLHELSLSWDSCGEPKSNATMNVEEVLEALQSPPNLKTLRIYDYEGSRLPSWIQKLKSLVTLELFDCKMCQQLPQLGKLPFSKGLKYFLWMMCNTWMMMNLATVWKSVSHLWSNSMFEGYQT